MYIYIYVQVIFIYIYISFHTYHTIFAKGQWLRVRERVPLLPLLFRSPSPCGEKCFLFVCPTYKYKVYVSWKTFGGQGPQRNTNYIAVYDAKAKWLTCQSSSLEQRHTHTQLHYKYVGKPLQLLQLLLTQSTEQDIVPSSISC